MDNSCTKKPGRPSAYESRIKPHLAKIRDSYNSGVPIKTIASDLLNISFNTLNQARKDHPELNDIFVNPNFVVLVKDLRGALYKRAMGFRETETKTVYEISKKDQAKPIITHIEKFTRYFPPDVAAINLALKNYDKEHWSNDPAELEIRKAQLALAREQAQNREKQGIDSETAEKGATNEIVLKALEMRSLEADSIKQDVKKGDQHAAA